MKTNIKFIVIVNILLLSCSAIFAQTVYYKDVFIMRGEKDIEKCNKCDWTKNCVYIANYNKYPCIVHFEYKLGSKNAPWQKYIIENDVEVSERPEYVEMGSTDVPFGLLEYRPVACFDSEIKALRITYVKRSR